jgi:hypothetical protein
MSVLNCSVFFFPPLNYRHVSGIVLRRADYETSLYAQKLALTSPTSCFRLVSIFRSRTKATELLVVKWYCAPFMKYYDDIKEEMSGTYSTHGKC